MVTVTLLDDPIVEDVTAALAATTPVVRIAFISPESEAARYIWYVNYQTPTGEYRWPTETALLTGVVSPSHADYVVVVGKDTEEGASIPAARKVFFQLEPEDPIPEYGIVAALDGHYRVAVPWIFAPYRESIQLDMPIKTKSLIVICSNKTATPLQQKRMELIKLLARDPTIDIDVYGLDHKAEDFPPGVYKGIYKPRDKSGILKDYRYCLSIEKHRMDNYITNHFIDPLLMYAMPLYSGAPNVDKLYPSDSFHQLGDLSCLEETVNRIKTLVCQPVTVTQVAAMSTARRLILNKYSLWATLKDRLSVK